MVTTLFPSTWLADDLTPGSDVGAFTKTGDRSRRLEVAKSAEILLEVLVLSRTAVVPLASSGNGCACREILVQRS
jgi:hypothetical protein